MTLNDARRLAESHLARFPELHAWRIGFSSKARRRLGVCRYRRREIVLTSFFVNANPPAKVAEVILHEIAHALVGRGHGHNQVWMKKAVELGVPPVRFCNAVMPPGDWRAMCSRCNKNFSMYGKPIRIRYCRRCGPHAGRLQFAHVRSDENHTPSLFSLPGESR